MKRTLGVTVSLTPLLLGSSAAVADRSEDLRTLSRIPQKSPDPLPAERPLDAQRPEYRLSAVEPLYTGREAAGLTAFDFCRAVQMDPGIARSFQTNNPQQVHPTGDQGTFVYDKLPEKFPDYHDEVSLKPQSGNPPLAHQAIVTTALALREIGREYSHTSGENQHTPHVRHDTHAHIEPNGAAILNTAVHADAAARLRQPHPLQHIRSRQLSVPPDDKYAGR